MTGLPTTTLLAEKLWLAAKLQGHRNPFGKPLAEYTVLELDWVLEMAARDDPKALTFVRGGAPSFARPEIFAAWASALTGAGLLDFMAGKWSAPAAAAGDRLRQRVVPDLTPRMTKGGKPI